MDTTAVSSSSAARASSGDAGEAEQEQVEVVVEDDDEWRQQPPIWRIDEARYVVSGNRKATERVALFGGVLMRAFDIKLTGCLGMVA